MSDQEDLILLKQRLKKIKQIQSTQPPSPIPLSAIKAVPSQTPLPQSNAKQIAIGVQLFKQSQQSEPGREQLWSRTKQKEPEKKQIKIIRNENRSERKHHRPDKQSQKGPEQRNQQESLVQMRQTRSSKYFAKVQKKNNSKTDRSSKGKNSHSRAKQYQHHRPPSSVELSLIKQRTDSQSSAEKFNPTHHESQVSQHMQNKAPAQQTKQQQNEGVKVEGLSSLINDHVQEKQSSQVQVIKKSQQKKQRPVQEIKQKEPRAKPLPEVQSKLNKQETQAELLKLAQFLDKGKSRPIQKKVSPQPASFGLQNFIKVQKKTVQKSQVQKTVQIFDIPAIKQTSQLPTASLDNIAKPALPREQTVRHKGQADRPGQAKQLVQAQVKKNQAQRRGEYLVKLPSKFQNKKKVPEIQNFHQEMQNSINILQIQKKKYEALKTAGSQSLPLTIPVPQIVRPRDLKAFKDAAKILKSINSVILGDRVS